LEKGRLGVDMEGVLASQELLVGQATAGKEGVRKQGVKRILRKREGVGRVGLLPSTAKSRWSISGNKSRKVT